MIRRTRCERCPTSFRVRSGLLALVVLCIAASARAEDGQLGVEAEPQDRKWIEGSFLGAYAASNDNVLDDANAYVGITVTRVVDNSPAQAAGLQVGDILLEANGTELDAPARLDQILFDLSPNSLLSLRIERDARVRELEIRTVPRLVPPPLATTGSQPAQPPTTTPSTGEIEPASSERRIERRHLGFEYRMASDARLRELGAEPGFGVEILSLAPRSPLVEVGVETGDLILEINGRAVPSAEAVADYFSDLSGASRVELTVLDEPRTPRTLSVPLYRPERILTDFRLPGIFSLERGKDTSEYSALLGAFRWTRLANGSRVRLLWWITFETGSPDELIDMGSKS